MSAASGTRRPPNLLRALRSPLRVARTARDRGIETLIPAALVVPGGARRRVGPPIAAALAAIASRRPGRLAPALAFVAGYASGRRAGAEALAMRLGTSPATAAEGRRRLARLAFAGRQRRAAAAIAASMPDDTSPDLELVRAQLAFDDGRYAEAVTLARAAAAGGARRGEGLADRAEGHLAVLRPGWLPDLGPSAAALRHARGSATPGRILHLVSISLPYREVGYTVRTQSVVGCQAGAGLDPHVVTRAGFPGTEGVTGAPAEQLVGGIPHHRVAPDYRYVGRPDRTLTASARATASLVAELRPAALQPASNHLQAQVALALAQPLGIPVVYEVRGFWEESWVSRWGIDEAASMDTDRYRMTREVETAAMRASAAVVTLSETMRDEIVARGIPADRVVIVPNAVEADRFVPGRRDDVLGSSLGIEPEDVVVGYISSFNAYEGIPDLVDAVARLRGTHPRLRLLLVGDGDDSDRIRERVRRHGLDDGTVVMTGRVPHDSVLRYYSLIDVFVVPRTAHRVSRLVTPLKPFEAMALERAVVVSDLPALREIVKPGETGLTFRSEDAADLAAVLGGLIDDPALRARLGRQAREWILAERTWDANGRRYRELFERLGVA